MSRSIPLWIRSCDGPGELTEYAWRFRYPGVPEGLSLEEAVEAVSVSRDVYDRILGFVGGFA